MSTAASSGTWTSRVTASQPASFTFTPVTSTAWLARHGRQRRVEAPVFQVAAEFDEGGHRQVGYPSFGRCAALHAPVAELPGHRAVTGHRQHHRAVGELVLDAHGAAKRQVG